MGSVQSQWLTVEHQERLRREAKIYRPWMQMNAGFGYAIAGFGEAWRPSLWWWQVRMMYIAAYVSVAISASYSAYGKRAEYADWHGTIRRLEMGHIWTEEFVTNSFGQVLLPCAFAKYTNRKVTRMVVKQDLWSRKTLPGAAAMGAYVVLGYPFFHYCWKPMCQGSVGRLLAWWKVFLTTDDEIETPTNVPGRGRFF